MVENDQDIRDRSNLSGAFSASASGVSSNAFTSILENVLSLEILPSENNDDNIYDAVLSAINEALRSEYEAYTESIGQKAETTLLAGTRRPEFWDAIIRQGADFIDGITVPNNNSDAAKQAAAKENGSNNFNRTLMIARAVQQTAEEIRNREINEQVQEAIECSQAAFDAIASAAAQERIDEILVSEILPQMHANMQNDYDSYTTPVELNFDSPSLLESPSIDTNPSASPSLSDVIASRLPRTLGRSETQLRGDHLVEGEPFHPGRLISALENVIMVNESLTIGESPEALAILLEELEAYNNQNGTNFVIEPSAIREAGLEIPASNSIINEFLAETQDEGPVQINAELIEEYIKHLTSEGLSQQRAEALIDSLTKTINDISYIDGQPENSASPSSPPDPAFYMPGYNL